MSARLSIVLPAYNAERHIGDALGSVLGQVGAEIEAICVDDGSTDGTAAILGERAAADPRLTVIRQGHGGAGAARNRGLDAAAGDYVLFLDADDRLEPDAAAVLLTRAEAAQADLVSFGCRLAMPPDACPSVMPAELSGRFCHGLWDGAFSRTDEGVAERLFQLGVGIHNSIYRTAFIRGAGLRFTGSVLGETIPFVSGALIHAERIALVRRELAAIGWWHGGGLVQRQLGSPDRYYGALAALKARLQEEGLYEELRRSFVNYATGLLADEIEAQRGYPGFTDAARRLRVPGFDNLDLLGHGREYYYDQRAHAAVMAVVTGSYRSDAEQEHHDLRQEKREMMRRIRALRGKAARLRRKAGKQGKRIRALKKSESTRRMMRRIASRLLRRMTGKGRGADPSEADALPRGDGGAGLGGNRAMNFSAGLRFEAICDAMSALGGEELARRRHVLARALASRKSLIAPMHIHGRKGVSDSNKAYAGFLDRLIAVLEEGEAHELAESIDALKTEAAGRTSETVKAAFLLQEAQVFPSMESVYTAASEDGRFSAAVVSAPLGSGRFEWRGREAEIMDRNGPVAAVPRARYSFFRESPDILIACRPYFGSDQAEKHINSKTDEFELAPPETSGLRCVYAPYAFFDTISEGMLRNGYQNVMHEYAWKALAYSDQILRNYRKYSRLEGGNCVMLGAPRFDVSSGVAGHREDERTEGFREAAKGRRTLLWNPHYGNPAHGAHDYLSYLDHVISFFEGRSDLCLFWRPHPALFDYLIMFDLMSKRDVDALVARVSDAENIILDRSPDYINAFALSDAMLTDGDSSLPYEYVATGKPVFWHRIYGGDPEFVRRHYEGKMPSLYYTSLNTDELDASLAAFAAGEDPRRDERMARAPEFIPGCDGHIGERVKDYLYEALVEDEKRLGASIVEEAVEEGEEGGANIVPAGSCDYAGLLASALDETPADDRESVTCLAVLSNTCLLSRGEWRGVVSALGALNGETPFAHIVHLGNLTGGDLGYAELQARVAGAALDLSSVGKAELLYAVGDLDANPAGDAPLSVREQSRLYLGRNLPRSFTDIKGRHLRLITLDSYDAGKDAPAGYGAECLAWLGHVLADMPPARRAVIFSHMPPASRLAPDVGAMRGEEGLAALLTEYEERVLCFVCGHGNDDYVDNDEAVPVVCCAGADTACFDAVAVDPVNDTVRFLRAGVGRGRIVEGNEARWL
jgi:glycosyltransferase EpsH